MSEEIARYWLEAVVTTAGNKDIKGGHLDLISRNVRLTGVEGVDVIGYDDWVRQCAHEFENNVLKSVSYQGIKILEAADGRILFKTCETVEGTDGTVIPRASRSCCNARKTTSGASCRSGF
jgi:hypothetical protein